MKVNIMSQAEVKRYSYKSGIPACVIISIVDSTASPVVFNRNPSIKAVLRLMFDDLPEDSTDGIIMSDDDGQQVREFVERWKDRVDHLIIHCQAGISRSAGVAAAILKAYDQDERIVWIRRNYD